MEMLTYCKHDIAVDHEAIVAEVKNIDLKTYHYDKFRNCYIFPLYNPAGNTGKVDISVKGEMKWSIDVPVITVKEVGTHQYKWRYVVEGDLNGLFFLNNKTEKVYPNKGERSYIMDGGHPHAIDVSPRDKFTICIGSPWRDNLPKQLNISNAYKISKPEIKESWSV